MKKPYIFFVILGIIILGIKYFQNKDQNNSREVLLTEIVGRKDFQESLKKLPIFSNKEAHISNEVANQSTSISSAEKVTRYDWPMLDKFKVDDKFKTNTENVLNIIKTQNDKGYEVFPLATIEMRNWISTMNKNPSLAKQTFSFLLSQPEIQSKEFMMAELIKVSKFINFDKQKIMKISENAIEEELSDETNVGKLNLEEYGHFLKVKESAIFILVSNRINQTGMEIAAKRILLKNKNPLIEREVISQLKSNYPNSKLILK